MTEPSLQTLLDQATHNEPPMGALVDCSLRAGRKLRRRRRQVRIAVAAVVGVTAASVPAANAQFGVHGHRPLSSLRIAGAVSWPVAFVADGSQIVPVETRTGATAAPVKVPRGTAMIMAVAPDGKGYVNGGTGDIVPVNLATRSAQRPIHLQSAPGHIIVTPDGRTAEVAQADGVVPIDLADGRAGKVIRTPGFLPVLLAVTPDSRIVYVAGYTPSRTRPKTTIVPVSTATNTPLTKITLDRAGAPAGLAVSPDGRTLVVLDEGPGSTRNSVTQINVASGQPSQPVPIRASGAVTALVLSPKGKIAYALSARAITPIDLAANRALPAIDFPAGTGYGYAMVITPNGNRLYALTGGQVVPIDTVTRTALKPIEVAGLDYPTAIAMNPNGKALYVGAGHAVVPISTATDLPGRPIPLGGTGFSARPWGFAFLQ